MPHLAEDVHRAGAEKEVPDRGGETVNAGDGGSVGGGQFAVGTELVGLRGGEAGTPLADL